MTTPAKSELDAARERLEDAYALGHEEVYCDEAAIEVRCEDLRLVLDALKEAESTAEAQRKEIARLRHICADAFALLPCIDGDRLAFVDFDIVPHVDLVAREFLRIKREGCPGVVHEVDQSFWDVERAERRLEVYERDALKAEVERLTADRLNLIGEAGAASTRANRLEAEVERLRAALGEMLTDLQREANCGTGYTMTGKWLDRMRAALRGEESPRG